MYDFENIRSTLFFSRQTYSGPVTKHVQPPYFLMNSQYDKPYEINDLNHVGGPEMSPRKVA